ncbi:MAG: sulfatase, partial [Thermoanaerobaculales bacterium]|nr:sulfatase [Thermoanaerobaculales bacterium]
FVFILISACAMTFVSFGCGKPAPPDATPSPANIIVVMVDTLRADHMSLYGYERTTTPFIDTFVSEATVFERARSQAGCTFPSVNSLFTSRYAFDFYVQGEGQMGIPAEYPTIAEVMRGRGYRTIAVSASPIVRSTPSKENPNGGFGAGFDVFDESCLWGDAATVNARALELLDEVEEPFFLYLHYMDPHGHYAPPATHQKQFAGAYDGHDFIAAGNFNPIAEMLYNDGPEVDFSDRDLQHLVDLYDDEILYFDGQFEQLITALREDDLLSRSLLVFTADHGEEFLEHGHVGHCRGVWDTLTRVPLFMRIPGLDGGGRVDAAVQLIDILPTLLDELGIDDAGIPFAGTTLRSLLEGGDPTRKYAFTDQSKYRAADDGRWQFILDGVESKVTLYDLDADPLEQNDLFTTSHPEGDRLGAILNGWLQDTGQWVRFDEALAASKAKEEELRALGYLR